MSEEYYCHKHSRAREIGESCPDCESETISSLRAEVDRLRAQLAEAQKVEKQEGMVSVPVDLLLDIMEWNWLDDDWPRDVRAKVDALIKAAQGEG